MRRLLPLSISFITLSASRIAIIIGLILIQIKLSKKENKYYGLILPAISFIFNTLLLLLNFSYDPDFGFQIIGLLAGIFIVNMKTLIFLLIYFVCRSNLKSKKELEKMKINDL